MARRPYNVEFQHDEVKACLAVAQFGHLCPLDLRPSPFFPSTPNDEGNHVS